MQTVSFGEQTQKKEKAKRFRLIFVIIKLLTDDSSNFAELLKENCIYIVIVGLL